MRLSSRSSFLSTQFESQAQKISLYQHLKLEESTRKLTLPIFVLFGIGAVLVGVLLNVDIAGSAQIAVSLMTMFYLSLISNAIYNLIGTYRPTYKRLLEYQRNQSSKQSVPETDAQNPSDDDDVQLREVVVSPNSSAHGTFYQMHGALDGALEDERSSQFKSPKQSSALNLSISAIDDDYNDTCAAPAGPENHTTDLAPQDEQTDQLVRPHGYPVRQDTASSTGTGDLQPAATRSLARRVNPK